MAKTTKSETKLLVIKQEVLEELILSTSKLQRAIASVIEGTLDTLALTPPAIAMKQAEEAEMEGEKENDEPAMTDEEEKLTNERARKAREGRVRYDKEKKAKEAEEAEAKAKTKAVKDKIKAVEAEQAEEASEQAEEPTMTEEEVMTELKKKGLALFQSDKESFQKILASFEVKAFSLLDLPNKIKALAMVEEASK